MHRLSRREPQRHRLQASLDLLGADGDGVVCDVGCGPAGAVARTMPSGRRVVSLDVDHAALLAARERVPGRWFVCADAAALPIRDARVEAVGAFGVLGAFAPAEAARAVREAARVLRPDGRLVALVSSADGRWLGAVRRMLLPDGWSAHRLDDLRAGLHAAGFARVTHTFVGSRIGVAADLVLARVAALATRLPPRAARRLVAASAVLLGPVAAGDYRRVESAGTSRLRYLFVTAVRDGRPVPGATVPRTFGG